MAKKAKFVGIIVIDTREQLPYEFNYLTVVKTLKVGDYSVEGMEMDVVVERKTKADIYGSVTSGRERFEREMVRLQQIKYAALVIESDLNGLLEAPPFSRVSPAVVVNTLVSWSIKYAVNIWLADNRQLAQQLTFRLLEKAWQAREEQKNVDRHRG